MLPLLTAPANKECSPGHFPAASSADAVASPRIRAMANFQEGRWLVEIEEGFFDLSESDNVFSFNGSDAYAFQADGTTYMTSWDFEDCQNEFAVQSEARSILEKFSSFMHVLYPDLAIVAGRVFRETTTGQLIRFPGLDSSCRPTRSLPNPARPSIL